MKTDMSHRYLQWVPVLVLGLSGLSSHYNLQSQVVDLRARYESTNQNMKDTLMDIRTQLKDQGDLLREINRNHGTTTQRTKS